MISRYARPEMLSLWSDDHRYATWLKVELCALSAIEESPGSKVPKGTTALLRQRAEALGPLDAKRIQEIETQTQHDVIAFLTHVEERLGPEARYLHLGMTSSDVLDTALAVVLCQATDHILGGLRTRLLPALKTQAETHKRTPMIGRSHGIHAEPITAGLMFLSSYAETQRALVRLTQARQEIAVGKLAGAVGVYGAALSPSIEAAALSSLGLRPETVATQVVARDRHAALFLAIALVGTAIERLATTVRHLQRTEVSEMEEPFGRKQKGSSAMPHKKNPILSENLCGLSRLLRAQASSALENVALWHERDISHSSVERVIAPDLTSLCDFMVQRAASLVAGLVVKPERMLHNLRAGSGLCFSEKVMLALIDTGLGRQKAYEIVQRSALLALEGKGDFRKLLGSDEDVRGRLSEESLDRCFDLAVHLGHVDAIFERTLASGGGPT